MKWRRGSFWDEGGLTRPAHSMRTYRKPNCPLKAVLPEVCARIYDILIAEGATDAVAKDAFLGYLDADIASLIESRYPLHERVRTSCKIL
jgi:hypothetical protein